MSLNRERRVAFYKTGRASVLVHFPNGDTVCRWCPFVRHDGSLNRHRCLFTSEYLPFPLDSRGNLCPILFEEEEVNEPDCQGDGGRFRPH